MLCAACLGVLLVVYHVKSAFLASEIALSVYIIYYLFSEAFLVEPTHLCAENPLKHNIFVPPEDNITWPQMWHDAFPLRPTRPSTDEGMIVGEQL
jgi:hypothetical protein